MQKRECLFAIIVLFALTCLNNCGPDSEENNSYTPLSVAESSFNEASEQYKIPKKILALTAFVESGGFDNTFELWEGQNLKPSQLGRSLFGLTPSQVTFNEKDTENTWKNQISNYAHWLNGQVTLSQLPKKILSVQDKFKWIWAVAKVHRSHKNTQAVFAHELIKSFNKGAQFAIYSVKEKMTILPDKTPLDLGKLDFYARRSLRIETQRGELLFARRMILPRSSASIKSQNATGIEIIHCPKKLSACLEMQFLADSPASLQTHYIIPQDDEISGVLQVNLHDEAVRYRNKEGQLVYRDGRIVIMLVGESGIFKSGKRSESRPLWLTKWQIKKMGKLIRELCYEMGQKNSSSEEEASSFYQECIQNEEKVRYQTMQNPSKAYWGDLPDYDQTLFTSYKKSLDSSEEASFLPTHGGTKLIQAGSPFSLRLSFHQSIAHVEIEQLYKCSDGSFRWALLSSDSIHNKNSLEKTKTLWNLGPNGDGKHFFRMKVYSDTGSFLGWDIQQLEVQKNSSMKPGVNPRVCS